MHSNEDPTQPKINKFKKIYIYVCVCVCVCVCVYSVTNLFLGLIWLMGHNFAKFGLKSLKFVFTKVRNCVDRLRVSTLGRQGIQSSGTR